MKLFALNLIGTVALGVSPGSATSDIVPADFSIAEIQASIRAACPVEAEQAAQTAVVVTESQPIADAVVLDMVFLTDFEEGIGYTNRTGDDFLPLYMDSEAERDYSILSTGMTLHYAKALGLGISFNTYLDDKEAMPSGIVQQTRAHIDIVKCLTDSAAIGAEYWNSVDRNDWNCFVEMFDGWTRILEKDALHLSMENASFDWDAARNAFINHLDYIAVKYPTCTIDRS